MVLHRMAEVNPRERKYPASVYEAPNNKPYQKLEQWDFTSLYPHVFSQSLPTGPGLLFEKENNFFNIKSMHDSGKRSSLEAVEWLEYLNSRSPWQQPIRHAWNFGEVKVAGYFLDGYVEIARNESDIPWKIGFEFMGMHSNMIF